MHNVAAHIPEPSIVPAVESGNEVCNEAPRLAAVKGKDDNDTSVRFLLGFIGTIFRSEELLEQRPKRTRS